MPHTDVEFHTIVAELRHDKARHTVGGTAWGAFRATAGLLLLPLVGVCSIPTSGTSFHLWWSLTGIGVAVVSMWPLLTFLHSRRQVRLARRRRVSYRQAGNRATARTMLAGTGIVLGVLLSTSCSSPTASDSAGTDTATLAPAQRWTQPGTDPGTSTPPPSKAATKLPPEAAGVDRTDPDATARAALAVWFTWNTNTDSGPNAGSVRAVPLLSSAFAARVTGSGSVSGPGGRWNQWAAQHASVRAVVAASTELVPPQSDTEAFRVFVVTQTVFTPTGQVIDTLTRTVAVKLNRTSPDWEVSSVDER